MICAYSSFAISHAGTQPPVTSEEEDLFTRLAADPNLYERVAKSIAPSIFGAIDIKKALACLLFGGSRKLMPDGLCRRGDINILMLGDPGTAKSQLLKFVEKVAPVAVYTSGKGSSAAGLTASVSRDPVNVSCISIKKKYPCCDMLTNIVFSEELCHGRWCDGSRGRWSCMHRRV